MTTPLRTTSLLLFFTTLAFGCGSSSGGAATAPTGSAGTSAAGSGGTGTAGTTSAAGKGGSAGATAGAAGTSTAGGAAGASGKGGAGGTGVGMGGAGGAAGKGAGGAAGAPANNSFDTAQPVMYDDGTMTNVVMATLDPPATETDYYVFTGKKGDALHLATSCKPQTDPYNPTFPDLVMTLFNDQKVQIANDDDSVFSNDPEIFTVLPADGTYYVRILECNAWDKGGPANCAPAAAITNKDYTFVVGLVDPKGASNSLETEPNDAAAMATKIKYAAAGPGQYFPSIAYGGFSSATDVDVYSFKLPADTMIQSGRSTGYFDWYPNGVDGSGSTTQFGEATVVDPADADPTHAVAKIPNGAVGHELSPPLKLGKDYLLVVKRGAMTGTNDFYFVEHFPGGSNPLEMEKAPGANDTVATAEKMMSQDNADGSQTFFIEGDITTPMDVDFFSAALTGPGINQVQAVCGAEGSGSGLRQMKIELLAADGTAIPGGSALDSFDAGAVVKPIALPAGATPTALVKISAAMVDATVTSTFYRCGITFSVK